MLTEMQYKILDFIEMYKNNHDGNAPNTVQIANEFHTSKQNIGSWCRILQQTKYIRIDRVNNRVQYIVIINYNWRNDKPDIMDANAPRTKRSERARVGYRLCKK